MYYKKKKNTLCKKFYMCVCIHKLWDIMIIFIQDMEAQGLPWWHSG